ncbi:MAG: sulfotransferase family protein [Phycisphaerae bacterium]
MPAQPTALLVLGMHRSGTSALTRILSLLGADLPSNLAGPNAGNEAGYWESLPLNALHEELFNALGFSWESLEKLPDHWFDSAAVTPFRQKLRAFLQHEFPASPLFVIKDPRISRLVPLWTRVLAELQIRPIFLLTLRNPLEVTASLERLYSVHPNYAQLLWLRYMLDAERLTRPFARAVISFEDLLADWRTPIARLAETAALRFPRPLDEVAPDVQAHLSPKLRHFHIAPATLEADPAVIWWTKALYATLQKAARTSLDSETEMLCTHLDKLATDAQHIYGPLLRSPKK